MRVSPVASRYARALYDVVKESDTLNEAVSELRILSEMFSETSEFKEWIGSQTVRATDKAAALKQALQGQKLSPAIASFIYLLAERQRLPLLAQITEGFQEELDKASGLCRGNVRSASALGQDERESIEKIVNKVINKKVIMSYKVDPTIIGGLIAEVGSYTFDDSLESHLRRMNEDLKRSTQ
jgi:F-type H+-transporting ATPase subunit delta